MTGLVEAGLPVSLHLLAGGQAQAALSLGFYPQSVRLPAHAPADIPAAHALVARHGICQQERPRLRQPRTDAGRRGLLEEQVGGRICRLDGFLEDMVALPKAQHFFFQQVDFEWGGGWIEHKMIILYSSKSVN